MAVVDVAIKQKARAAVRVLARRAHVRAAYLFGSRVEGTADQWSDIDIAAFIDEADAWDLDQRVAACVEPQQLVGNDIELHLFSTRSLRNPPRASFAQYVLRHGVPLDIDEADTQTK
ncbi:MAG: nucleotidyltransferase domain-containing protein [Vicinamibacterales bacterium]